MSDEFEEGVYKLSGLGRLNGVAAMNDFSEYKHVYHNSGKLNMWEGLPANPGSTTSFNENWRQVLMIEGIFKQ